MLVTLCCEQLVTERIGLFGVTFNAWAIVLIKKGRGMNRHMDVALLNVVMPQPHSAARYVELFTRAYRLRKPIKIRGETVAFLGAARRNEDLIEGEVFRYLDLDKLQDWYNLQTAEVANDEDLAQVSVPEHLKPHFKTFPYVFDTRRHRLAFITSEGKDHMTPGAMRAFFGKLFKESRIVETYGDVEVIIEPDREQLDRILRIYQLKKLTVHISNPPNADDFSLEENEYLRRMTEMHVKKETYIFESSSRDSISISENLENIAEIAKSNGYVSGKGRDETGRPVELATRDQPWVEEAEYDPAIQSRWDILRDRLARMIRQLRPR